MSERSDSMADAIEKHADLILRASGSGLRHYTMQKTRAAILMAVADCFEEAYRAGAENEMRTAELDFAVEKMTAYRAENELLREVVKVADDAINEMFRYFDGGETRGSYDGKPERAQLRKAGYAARNALAQVAK